MANKSRLSKPPSRIATLDTNRVETIQPGQWRDKRNDGSTARGYGYRWQKAREQFLLEHPLCVMCKAEGSTRVATVVDHITPHRGDQTLFWDRAGNWQALCATCHSSRKQSEESRGV